MERSEQVNELMTALAKAQAQMKNPGFDATNPHFKNKYASLAAVRDAVLPVLTAHGLALTQLVSTEGDQVVCTTVLWHSSGQYLGSTLHLPAARNDAQGYGSAITYARRYSLMALCCVAGDEDDDGEAAVAPARSQAQNGPAKAKQAPSAAKEWTDKINGLMTLHEKTEAEQQTYWAWVERKYGPDWSLNGQKLYQELEARAQAKGSRREGAVLDATGQPVSEEG